MYLLNHLNKIANELYSSAIKKQNPAFEQSLNTLFKTTSFSVDLQKTPTIKSLDTNLLNFYPFAEQFKKTKDIFYVYPFDYYDTNLL